MRNIIKCPPIYSYNLFEWETCLKINREGAYDDEGTLPNCLHSKILRISRYRILKDIFRTQILL